MAQHDNSMSEKIVATGDLGAAQRTIGGILGQFDAVEVDKATAVAILSGAGLPAIAYDDPSFPISLRQDFELLNEIRKYQATDVSIEVNLFHRIQGTRVSMFGAMGLAWQSAPTILDAVQALVSYPQASWGRCRMVVCASESEERVDYSLDKSLVSLVRPEDIEATYKYALLLEISAGVAVALDIVSDRSLVAVVRLPFERPADWSVVENTLAVPVEFEAPQASVVYKPGYLRSVPKRSHDVSFRLAMKIVGKESAILEEDTSFRNRVVRWLWASTPPLKKAEIAKLLGVSERSLTRQLASEGTNYNQLFAEVQSERAENLLGNPKLTISEVAYRMGYSDPAAFTRAFTGWHGITPSDWRLTE